MTGFLRRLLIRATAGLLLLIAVAGLPAGLVTFIGWPLPSAWPTRDEAAGWLTAPATDTMIVNALAVAAWLLWAALLHAIASEARAAWRGMPTRATTGRTANPLRFAAATLVTALTLGTVLSGASAASPTPANANPAVTLAVKANLPVQVKQGTAIIHVGATSYRYVVERRDTLSKISKAWLGDPERWPEICELNWHRHFPKVGGTLRDCDLIYPGWDLRLPADAKPPRSAIPAPPIPARPGPGPSGAAQPTPVPPASPQVPDDPDGVIESLTETAPTTSPSATASGQPTTSPTTPASPSASPPVSEDADAASPQADDQGVSLPDAGFVPWALAAAITAAAAMVWLQRRRRFIPSGDEDPQPAQLSPPVIELHRQVARNPNLPTPGDLAERAAAVPALPLLPPGGIGLLGDGAHAAARAALISTLASGGPHDPDRRGEVVIDGTTLTTLIGADAATLGPWPRLHIADDLDHALTILDSRLLHRARILDEHSLTDLDSLRERAPDEEALPPVLLITETPPAGARMRARVSFGLGSGMDVSALLLGEWPHGTTINVAADGHTHLVDGTSADTIGDRLAVLSTEQAVGILTTLREAHTGEPPTIAVRPPTPRRQATPTSPAASRADAEGQRPGDVTDSGGEPKPKARLSVFGTPRVEDLTLPGRPLRGKAAELAVYLACHPDGADTHTIGEHIAPEYRVRAADQQVHTNASNLRHVLGRTPAGPRPGGYVLKRGASSRYRLDPATVDVDLWQLRDLLSRARLASAPTRTELLRQACELYTAPLADACDYDWVDPYRETARQWAIETHLLLADDLLQTDPQAASDLLDKAIGLDRYNEELYRKAMHARYALGDADGIRTLLRAITKNLADLATEPSAATTELAAQLRASLDQR